MKLTPKQESFCLKYLECGNASEAYRSAYNCRKMKTETVNTKASNLLKKDKIRTRVEELQEESRETSKITKEKILDELASIAFSSVADMNKSWIERKEFVKLSRKEKAAIKSISTKVLKKNIGSAENPDWVDVEYIKIELHDKIKAIERICKMLGFDSPEKMQVEKINSYENMTDEELAKEIEMTKKKILEEG